MGGRAFILLKTGRGRPESAKQAEIRLASLQKILRIGGFGKPAPLATAGRDSLRLCRSDSCPDMANSGGIAGSVIQITVLAGKPAQYAAKGCRGKITKVSGLVSIAPITSERPIDGYQDIWILAGAVRIPRPF